MWKECFDGSKDHCQRNNKQRKIAGNPVVLGNATCEQLLGEHYTDK